MLFFNWLQNFNSLVSVNDATFSFKFVFASKFKFLPDASTWEPHRHPKVNVCKGTPQLPPHGSPFLTKSVNVALLSSSHQVQNVDNAMFNSSLPSPPLTNICQASIWLPHLSLSPRLHSAATCLFRPFFAAFQMTAAASFLPRLLLVSSVSK